MPISFKPVILESPFRGKTPEQGSDFLAYAKRCMKHSLSLGETPFASHLLYPQVLDDTDAEQRARGIEAGYNWGKFADKIVFYIDFGVSDGMLLAMHNYVNRPVEFRKILGPQ